MAPRLGGIKQKKLIFIPSTSMWFLLFYSPKPRGQVRILIYRKWSIRDSDVSVILVGLSINWERLKLLQKSNRDFDPVSLALRRLQFRSAKMKMGIFMDITEVNASLNSDSKQERGVSGGLYAEQIRNDLKLLTCTLSHSWWNPDSAM